MGVVEVEVVAVQAIGPAGPTKARRRGPHQRPAETPVGAGDRDAHQRSRAIGRQPRAPEPRPVLPLVVVVPVAGPCGPPPGLVGDEPVDRRGQPVLERCPRPPAERGELAPVHRVAPVVTRPILDMADERPGLAEPVEQQATVSLFVISTPPAML